nr:transposase [Streptomyces sp. CB02058]
MWVWIECHREVVLRVVGSIRTGVVRVCGVIGVLSRGGRPILLGDAITQYGWVVMALRILRFTEEPGCRRQTKVQAGLRDGRCAFARKIFRGWAGQLRQCCQVRHGGPDRGARPGPRRARVVQRPLYGSRFRPAVRRRFRGA